METKYAIVKFDKSDEKTYTYACNENVQVGDVVAINCKGFDKPQQALVLQVCNLADEQLPLPKKYIKPVFGIVAKQDYAPKFLPERVRYSFLKLPYLDRVWQKHRAFKQGKKLGLCCKYVLSFESSKLVVFGRGKTFLIQCCINLQNCYTLGSEILCTSKFEFAYVLNKLKNNIYMYFKLPEVFHFKDLEKMIHNPTLYDW